MWPFYCGQHVAPGCQHGVAVAVRWKESDRREVFVSAVATPEVQFRH